MYYYLVGIKGTGMSALAAMLYDCGHNVIGSDVSLNYGFEQELTKRHIQILEFSSSNITGDHIYIIGNAYNDDNEEVKSIKTNKFKFYYYHEFISKLEGFHIAVSGTHGKTTTTNFIKQLLKDEPIAYIIGDGTGGGCTNYKYLIYEACEYQDHFLVYNPDILVITNIDYDHPDYFKSIDEVRKSFAILKEKSKLTIEQEEYEIIEISKNLTKFKYDSNIYSVRLFGDHLISDLVIAIKVLFKLGFDYKYIVDRLNRIKMPKRRMQESIISNTIIIEDYGHHPTEINALIQSINIKYPNIYKICLFQPHTYSRTLMFYKDFIKSLRYFDEVYVDEVFTSKREPYDLNKQNKINYIFNEFNNYLEFDFDNLDLRKKQMIILLGAGDLNKRFFENVKMKTE